MGDSNTLTVKTKLGEVNVHEMPLRDYAELLRALERLPEIIGKFTKSDIKDLSEAETFDMIRDVLTESWDDLINLIAVPTDKDGEFLGSINGADAIDVIDAVLELNDIPRIIAAVKKIWARRAKMVQSQKAQS